MEKDSRLEIRIALQQLEELDAIRAAVNPPYTPSRSDVARMLIAKGIEDYKKDGESSPLELSLGDRLMLYFQLYPIPAPEKSSSNFNGGQNRRPSVSFGEVLREVYKQKYFWFFELEKSSVELLSSGFGWSPVDTVLNSTPNVDTNRSFVTVSKIVKMFIDIESCIYNASAENDGDVDVVESLCNRLGIPLKFGGFDINLPKLVQMADLFIFVNELPYGRRGGGVDTKGLSLQFLEQMLLVYVDALQGSSSMSMSRLKKMTDDRRLV
ncbi:hypothetical protein IFT86_19275 [Pseudomonas syringae]|uniref:hypothetical protein n=1 Tax=Pseudomonas syringae TaxID=317 RepID=UPI00177F02BA|nr:hypothetical protein [Pseudomonas syringae]